MDEKSTLFCKFLNNLLIKKFNFKVNFFSTAQKIEKNKRNMFGLYEKFKEILDGKFFLMGVEVFHRQHISSTRIFIDQTFD